jgi:hypothetical protein
MTAALQATLEFLKVYWAPLLGGVAVVAILPLIVGLGPCAWGHMACCSRSRTR